MLSRILVRMEIVDTYMYVYLLVLTGVLGMVLGSFINCWAWRCMHGESVLEGRSHCTSCGHVLEPRDLIPVLSWVLSGGKCRYCGEHVSVRYPLTELVLGVSFVAILAVYGPTLETLELCLFACVLLFLSLTDIDDYLIPNACIVVALVIRCVYLAIMCALGSMTTADLLFYVGSAVGVSVVLLATVLVADHVLGRESMGGGDLKLYAVAALYFGWQQMLFLIVVSCLLGLGSTVFFRGRALEEGEGQEAGVQSQDDSGEQDQPEPTGSQPFPFGPSIALACVITMLCGGPVISWYLSLFP